MFPLPFMVGDGAEEGRRLELGAEEFHDAHSALELAIADPSYWTGDAADAYNQQAHAQLPRMTEMARIDLALREIIAQQAEECEKAHQAIEICESVLECATPIALLLKAIQPGGDAVSLAFQIATAVGTLGGAVAEIGVTVSNAETNKSAIDLLTTDYKNLGANAHLDGAEGVEVKVGEEQGTSLDSVNGLMSSGAGGVPPAIAARGAGNGTAQGSPSGAGAEGEGDFGAADAGADQWNSAGGDFAAASADTGADTGAGPEEDTPAGAPPIFGGMPSPGQIASGASQASKQAAQFSKDAGQHVGLVNETMSSAGQLSSMFPDGQAGSGDPAPAGQFEGAGAGTDGAERAPVDDTERAPVDDTGSVEGQAAQADQMARVL